VGIAAAPDFTEDSLWAGMTEAERARLTRDGRIERPSAYSGEPYVFTRRLIEDGRRHLVLRAPLHLACPLRLLQGTADADVPPSVALRLFDHAQAPDARLTLVKGADHRFSSPACLALMTDTVAELVEEGGNA
jgi:pimeloyl-ACP methyl ester carboxylesterase